MKNRIIQIKVAVVLVFLVHSSFFPSKIRAQDFSNCVTRELSEIDHAELLVDAPESEQFQRIWLRESEKAAYGKLPPFKEKFYIIPDKYRSEDFWPTTGIKIVPDRALLNAIVSHVNELLSPGNIKKYSFSEKDSLFFKAVISEAKKQIASEDVAYEDYINVRHYFAVAMNLRSQQAFRLHLEPFHSNINSDLIDPSLPKGK